MADVDVIVIGSGQAGVPLSIQFAKDGRRVALVERAEPGGTCVNSGCTPTKTLIASARAAHVARTAERLGVRTGSVAVDFEAVHRRMDATVRRFRDDVRRRLEAAGERLRLVTGQARFVAPRSVEVFGERFAAEVVVIDVGARAALPELPGLEAVPWLDSRRILNLRKLPTHLVVLGGGAVGCELAQAFRRFGADVTIVERGEHLLGGEEPEISREIEAVFAREGIRLELGASVASVAARGLSVLVRLGDGREIDGSHLLLATGRRPNTDDLGCNAAGIELDERGYVRVSERFETSVPGVYAVGDASGAPQFTHVAWDDHRLLLDVLAGKPTRPRSERSYPYAVFTDPEVAGVGLDEAQARAAGIACEVATLPLERVARAVQTDETRGLFKVLIEPRDERLLGARIVAPGAGELIHAFVVMLEARAPVRSVIGAEFVHPTFSEGVQAALRALERDAS